MASTVPRYAGTEGYLPKQLRHWAGETADAANAMSSLMRCRGGRGCQDLAGLFCGTQNIGRATVGQPELVPDSTPRSIRNDQDRESNMRLTDLTRRMIPLRSMMWAAHKATRPRPFCVRRACARTARPCLILTCCDCSTDIDRPRRTPRQPCAWKSQAIGCQLRLSFAMAPGLLLIGGLYARAG